ncbi:hypothetical protein BGZ58_009093 [Dissophora ornata]|nr:hypothetical protein BGZ58_009093 [Dissophora ornata]
MDPHHSPASAAALAGTSSKQHCKNSRYETGDGRPRFLIQSGAEVLDSINIDPASVITSKLKGLVKGTIIGYRYTCIPSGCSSSLAAPAVRKFQVKFRSPVECGQCAEILSAYFECSTVSVGVVASVGRSSNNNNDDVTRALTGGSHENERPIIATETCFNSNVTPLGIDTSRHALTGSQSQIPVFGNHELSQFSSPLTITPRFGSQPIPVLSTVTLSSSSSSAISSTLSVASTPISASTATVESAAPSMDLRQLLNMSEKGLQDEIFKILQDPAFPELLVKVEQVMRDRRSS